MPRCIKIYKNKTNNSISSSSSPPPKEINIFNSSSREGIINNISSNIISGFSFGIGSSIARNALDNLFINKNESTNNCKGYEKKIFNDYTDCIKNNNEEFCKDFYINFPNTDFK